MKKTVKDYSDCGTFFTGQYTIEYDENSAKPHKGVVTETNPRWPEARPSEARSMTVKVGTKVELY